MRWWQPLLGRKHENSGSGGGGKRSRRGVFAAIMGAGLAVGLLVLVIALPTLAHLPARPGSAARHSSAATVTGQSSAPTATAVPTPPIEAAEPQLTWPTYMGQSARTGQAGDETTLTAATAGKLKLKWQRQAGGTIFAQPVVVNGVIYWGAWDGYEHATSAATGVDVWSRYLGQTSVLDCEGAVLGVSSTATVEFAPVHGRRTLLVYVGGGNGVFYALDALTGAVVWQTSLGQPPAAYLWSSPAYYDDDVYMGVASVGDCPLVQGKVVKLSAGTGKQEAVFDVVPNGCLGGTVWGSVTIDQNTGMLYVGTGNPGDCPVNEPFSDAFVALRTSDLGLVGAWQDNLALQFSDSDFGSTPTLFTAQVNGSARQLVGIVNKDGNFYAFDAAQLSRGPIWTTRVADVALCPYCGDGGYVPGAWDGKLLYESGGKTTINGTFCAGGLRALNPANGSLAWSGCFAGPTFGALTLGPDFVVIGAAPRLLVVGTAGAAKGRVLFSFQDPQAPNTRFFGAPSIADGILIVGDADGNLFALGE